MTYGKSFFFLVLALLGQPTAAWAKPTASKPATVKLSSADNRKGIEYELLLNPIVATDKGSGAGGVLGIMLQDDVWLEAGGSTVRSAGTEGSSSTSSPNSNVEQTTAKFTFARLKYFVGNSFFVYAGAGQRDVSVQVDPSQSYAYADGGGWQPKTGPKYWLFNRTMGAVAGLGNQWQWSSFTLGAEWVGVYAPLMVKETSASEIARRKAAQDLGSGTSTFALTFLIGYSF